MTSAFTDLGEHYASADPAVPGERFAGYVEAAGRGELALPWCNGCLRFHWYPLPRCPHCHTPGWEWRSVPAFGRVFSFTVLRRPLHPSLAERTGEIVALVCPEASSEEVRLVTNFVGQQPPTIDARVALHFVWVGDVPLPVCTLAPDQSDTETGVGGPPT